MSKRMDVRVKLSYFSSEFVRALQNFMISWNFDPCGLESRDPWTGIFVSSTADGPVAPKTHEFAAEACECNHENTVHHTFIGAHRVRICKDCGVLLGSL